MTLVDRSLINFSKFLFILLPFSIALSSFAMDLSIVLIDIIFIYLIIKKKNFSLYFYNFYSIISLVFCMYLIGLSLLSNNIYLSLSSSLFYIRFFIFGIAGYFILQNDKKIIKFFFYSLLSIYIILFIDANIQYFINSNIIGFVPQNNRITSFFNDEAILGSFLSRNLTLLVLLFFLISLNKNLNSIYPILFIVMISWIIVISGGRTSLIYYIIILLNLIIFIKYFRFKLLILFSVIILFLGAVILSTDNLKNRFIYHTFDQLSSVDNILKISKEHNTMYQKAFIIFSENIFFGTGPKTFRIECNNQKYINIMEEKYRNNSQELISNSCSTHPHNITLQALSETGIIGYAFFMLIYIFIIKNYLNFIKNSKLENKHYISLLFSIGLLINLFPIGPSGNIFHNWLSAITFLPIPFYFYSINYFRINKV